MVELGVVEFNDLPEGCIANIVSFTTPRDACTLSLVSSTFRSAAESDAVWERFLPSDYHTVISQSSTATSSFRSKKHLYRDLTQNPLLIHDGKMSFQLDKVYGKKCYMLSARNLFIVWGDTPTYWRWISLPDSRFSEVAELVSVCWLEIRGCINTRLLSAETLYGAYLVFKPSPAGSYGFRNQLVEVSVTIAGAETAETRRRTVFLDVDMGRARRRQILRRRAGIVTRSRFLSNVGDHHNNNNNNNLDIDQFPKEMGDGWVEMELGDFFNQGGEDKEVEMGVYEIKGGGWKSGIIVQGIEIRPKTISINK